MMLFSGFNARLVWLRPLVLMAGVPLPQSVTAAVIHEKRAGNQGSEEMCQGHRALWLLLQNQQRCF